MPVKTDDKKQHFDDIYVADTPVPYKTEILDKLHYVSDNFNRQMFDRLILPWIQSQAKPSIHYVDLCACFGNTTMATVHGMTYAEICDNWKDSESCQSINKPRRFHCTTTAIDISENAMSYSQKVGLFDETIVVDLNNTSMCEKQQRVAQVMSEADVLLSTAALVYLDMTTIERLVSAFACTNKEGYMLVNFLNPFALDKADETKRILLQHLDFVGSMATRHRQLSALEKSNYPGEEWALLELWVLKRRKRSTT